MAASILSTDSPSLNRGASGPGLLVGDQCRAARAMLDWSQKDLARHARISAVTVRGFERGHTRIKPSTARLLRLTFEVAGVRFIEASPSCGAGVRLAEPVD